MSYISVKFGNEAIKITLDRYNANISHHHFTDNFPDPYKSKLRYNDHNIIIVTSLYI